MALSFQNVERAYEVFNELQKTVLPELSIDSFPVDLTDLSYEEKARPRVNEVYGFDRKSDSGWENLVFFVKNPSDELKQKFEELKTKVGNSSMSHPYHRNADLWVFGWF